MERHLVCIVVACGLLIGIDPAPCGTGPTEPAVPAESLADIVAGLRRPIEQVALAGAIVGVALYLQVRDGGAITVPTSPVDLW